MKCLPKASDVPTGTTSRTKWNTDTKCKTCTKGQYALSATAEACKGCPYGKVQPFEVAKLYECALCLAGTEFVGVQADCKECADGKYQDSNSFLAAKCKFCEAGKQFESKVEPCSACATGRYQESGGGGASGGVSKCKACGKGQYAPTATTTCASCPSGQYQDKVEAMQNKCTACSKGQASPSSAEPCKACEAGQYQNESIASSFGCSACRVNTEFVNTTSPCRTCQEGQFQPFDLMRSHVAKCRLTVQCSPGKESVEGKCRDCKLGRYRVSNSSDWLVNLVVVVSSLMRLTSRAWHALKDGFSPRMRQIRQTRLACPAGWYHDISKQDCVICAKKATSHNQE